MLAFAAGTVIDRPRENPPLTVGGYRVLAADFHTHSTTWSDGGLTPFGIVLEAERQGLDAIAITGHNQVSDAKAGRWFSRIAGGPTVLVGQEIVSAAAPNVPPKIVNLMDALKKSLDTVSAGKKKPAKASVEKPAASKRKRA